MFHTLIRMDPTRREAVGILGDADRLHKLVMSGFPKASGTSPRAEMGVLFRLCRPPADPGFALLVQSTAPPMWPALPAGFAAGPSVNVRDQLDAVRAADVLAFRLDASPSKSHRGELLPTGRLTRGKRFPLRTTADRAEWMRHQAEANGCEIVSLNVRPRTLCLASQAGPVATITTFTGTLLVQDAAKLREACTHGIGPGKSYGAGLLVLEGRVHRSCGMTLDLGLRGASTKQPFRSQWSRHKALS